MNDPDADGQAPPSCRVRPDGSILAEVRFGYAGLSTRSPEVLGAIAGIFILLAVGGLLIAIGAPIVGFPICALSLAAVSVGAISTRRCTLIGTPDELDIAGVLTVRTEGVGIRVSKAFKKGGKNRALEVLLNGEVIDSWHVPANQVPIARWFVEHLPEAAE